MAGEALLSANEVIELLRLAARERERDYHARMAIQQLTQREKEVLEALAQGLNDREIAERLHISFETERSHMTNVLTKLGASSRLQALVLSARGGIIEMR